ncbi:Alpha/Beta hydrolase protein [Sphaerosporella brunnea]|uniref:Alpha/Beta hydrolase protein n=1 Tax=Sphaerosporella brunnea TaxID=1250544 RepID=A0A5J5F2B1_9PEZI|nr:Alpha/Beta hydrolase protein [Sphaerosporella brunnea]
MSDEELDENSDGGGGGQKRTMLYVHGGAYYFGSVDEHRYQLQRHARKLSAKVFAPRYRLAPQFPFPCALYDVLACYFYLLEQQPAESIIFAGDSAGGGLILSLLCLLRDQGLPLPAGAVLISPWVDLCHSFPSVISDNSKDYIPPHGFLHRPSAAWPPPPPKKCDDGSYAERDQARVLQVPIDGETVEITDQIQLYTTNDLLPHPLVSPVNQRTLGGLCPLLVLVGGGEVLRDEQVFVAHKAAFPSTFDKAPAATPLATATAEGETLAADTVSPDGPSATDYPPTAVHLQVFPDACHVLPTLAWTRPAKRMCASIAAFGKKVFDAPPGEIQGFTYEVVTIADATPVSQEPLTPKDFPAPELIGVVTPEPVKRWMVARRKWDEKYPPSSSRELGLVALCGGACVGGRHKSKKDEKKGKEEYEEEEMEELLCEWEGEFPPPSAAVLRRGAMKEREGEKPSEGETKQEKGWGMSIWAGWGAKSDDRRVRSEEPHMETVRNRSRSRSRSGGSVAPTLPPIEID